MLSVFFLCLFVCVPKCEICLLLLNYLFSSICVLCLGICRLEVFDHSKFDKWVEKGIAPAIAPSFKLYQKVVDLGYKVILLTGRRENHRVITVENLRNAGFHNWDKLILR